MKLRPRIALVSCLVALASVSATGALLIRHSRSYGQKELLERQMLLAQNRGFALSDSIDVAAQELTRLSHMAEVDLTDNDLRPEATLLAHAHRNSTLFNIGLQIEDATGRCLWSEPASADCSGKSYAGEPWFVEGRKATSAVVVGESATDSVLINLVVPIHGKPGASDGVLRGIIDPRSDRIISPILSAALSSGAEATLVDRSGRFLSPAPRERGTGWAKVLAARPTQEAGVFAVDEVGGRFIYAHAPIPHIGWGLVLRWPYRLLDVALERQVALLLRILAFGGLVAVILGYVSSRFLTRPLENLLEGVRALIASRSGQSQRKPDTSDTSMVSRTDELGEVARAFADLRAQLRRGDDLHEADLAQIRELARSLEARVSERTAELEQAQRSLLAQEKLAAMGRAAAVISHELKNSLNALGMAFDLVALEASKIPHLGRVNAQVREEVMRLRTLTDELLLFARTPRMNVDSHDLNGLIRTTTELCAEQASAAGIGLQATLGDEPVTISCDAELIRSVLVNLLQNAIEAVAWAAPASKSREVAISVEAPNGDSPPFVSIVIDDSGPGVAAEARDHLFEPFFTTKRNGTGLGLATAQRFASAHGGHIELQVSPLGGARFRVRLPFRGIIRSKEAA
jgi:signal transduction histidine kinase